MSPFSSRSILACLLPTVIAVLSVYWFRKKRKLKENKEACKLQKPSIELSQTKCQNLEASGSSQTECQNLGNSGSSQTECQNLGNSGSSQKECQNFGMPETIFLPKQSDNSVSEGKIETCFDSDTNDGVKSDSNFADEESLLLTSSVSHCPAWGEENHVQHATNSSIESKCNGFVNKESNYNHIADLHSEKKTSTKLQNKLNRTHKGITEQFNDNFLEAALTIIYDSSAEVIPEENALELQLDETDCSLDVQQQLDVQTNAAALLPADNLNDVSSSSIGNTNRADTKVSNSAEFVQSTNSPLSNPSDCDILSSVGTSSISLNEFASTSPLNSPHEQSSILIDSAIGDEEELSNDSGNCSIRGSISRSSANHDLESHPDMKQLTDTSLSSTDGNSLLDQNTTPLQNDHDSSELSRCSDGLNCEPNSSQHAADAPSEVSVENNKSSGHAIAVKNYESSNRYVYEFELPYELCGRLIGRQGKYVKYIKELTNASACIKRHPFNDALKLVSVEGTRSNVNYALDQIRKRFPVALFPAVSLAQTNAPVDALNVPEPLQLHLPEQVSVDVILSSMVTAGHFFLQQPTHPTYPSLSTLDQCMMTCYTQAETPALPSHIDAGVICAATIMGGWYRAQVMYVFENGDQCEIKYVDYGGYSHVPSSSLRQIRSDFMTLPFQASECYLANVLPLNVEVGWTPEGAAVFEELAQGQILQAVVGDFHEDGTPQVQLYRVQGISSTHINRELVNRGVATWVENR